MTPTPNPTTEQIVADAITAYWADEERSGPNRGPLAHDFACGEAATAALRAHGLLSEGAPSEEPTDEQVEAAAKAMHETGNPWFAAYGAWGAAGFEIKQAFRDSACAALLAAATIPQPVIDEAALAEVRRQAAGEALDMAANWVALMGTTEAVTALRARAAEIRERKS